MCTIKAIVSVYVHDNTRGWYWGRSRLIFLFLFPSFSPIHFLLSSSYSRPSLQSISFSPVPIPVLLSNLFPPLQFLFPSCSPVHFLLSSSYSFPSLHPPLPSFSSIPIIFFYLFISINSKKHFNKTLHIIYTKYDIIPSFSLQNIQCRYDEE